MTDFFLEADNRIKRAGEIKPYTIDLKRYLRSYWIAGRTYGAGEYTRSPSISGFAYQASAAGEAGLKEPQWPLVLGGTVTDGSLTWTAVAPASNAVDTISSVVWSQVNAPDGALVIGNVVQTNEETSAKFSGGTQGAKYRIQCAVTTAASNLYQVQFDLEIA